MAKSTRILGRDAILAAQDIVTEELYIKEWDGSVLIRGMSGTERDAFEASLTRGKGANRDINLQNFRAKLVAHSVVDEQGERVFSETEVGAIGRKSAGTLQRIIDVANRLSGLSQEDVEELTGEGGSDAQSDASTSA